MGHQLFTGTGLTIDQHGNRRTGQTTNGAEHLLHRWRFTDNFRRCGGDLLTGPAFISLLVQMTFSALYQGDGFIDIKGFRQIFKCPALIGIDRTVQIRMRGHDNDRDIRLFSLDEL